MSPTLLSLPPELLTDIISQTADFTGGSHWSSTILNSVCRVFRTICFTTGIDVRYAYVHGVPNINLFSKVLRQREEAGRKVRSLMLVEDDYENATYSPDLGFLSDVLRSIHPNFLCVLAVFLPVPFSNVNDARLPIPVPLPHLRHLFLSGAYLQHLPAHDHEPPRMPGLERLHITRAIKLPLSSLSQVISQLCPRLAHLHLSSSPTALTGTPSLDVLHLFIHAGSDTSSETTTSPESHPFPSSLQQIIIEFYPCYISQDFPAFMDPIGTYRSAIGVFQHAMGVPIPLVHVQTKAPLVVMPIPEVRGLERFSEDEEVLRDGLEEMWRACTVRMEGELCNGPVTHGRLYE